jgi:hypothetical protein
MMRLNVKVAAVLIAVILATSPAALAVGTVTQTPTNDTAPVSAAALYRLYRDKTWLWPNGAGFFAKDGRFNFLGGLCINAAWRSKDWIKVNLTCFSHSKDGNLLYQKREPSGAWAVFRSFPGKPDDEYQKLRKGDLVEVEFLKRKAMISQKQE